MKELLTDENKLYRLAFVESNVDRRWDRFISSDESTFSSVMDGWVLVYSPRGERHNWQHMSTCKRSSRVSVHCWRWISHERGGMLQRVDGHLDRLQYKHILQNVMVCSVRPSITMLQSVSSKTFPPFMKMLRLSVSFDQ